MFSFQTILDNLPVLVASARYTLLISGAGCFLGLILGALICVAAVSRNRVSAASTLSYQSRQPVLASCSSVPQWPASWQQSTWAPVP